MERTLLPIWIRAIFNECPYQKIFNRKMPLNLQNYLLFQHLALLVQYLVLLRWVYIGVSATRYPLHGICYTVSTTRYPLHGIHYTPFGIQTRWFIYNIHSCPKLVLFFGVVNVNKDEEDSALLFLDEQGTDYSLHGTRKSRKFDYTTLFVLLLHVFFE